MERRITRAKLSDIARDLGRSLPDSQAKNAEIWRLEELARTC